MTDNELSHCLNKVQSCHSWRLGPPDASRKTKTNIKNLLLSWNFKWKSVRCYLHNKTDKKYIFFRYWKYLFLCFICAAKVCSNKQRQSKTHNVQLLNVNRVWLWWNLPGTDLILKTTILNPQKGFKIICSVHFESIFSCNVPSLKSYHLYHLFGITTWLSGLLQYTYPIIIV